MKQLLQLLLLLLITGCTTIAGGGGADVGNPTMMGVVLTAAHEGAAGVELYLLPSDYLAEGSKPAEKYRTTSDENGRYSFAVEEGVSYTLSAHTSENGADYSLFRRGISSGDRIYYDILEKSVTLSLTVPDELINREGTLTMPGLPHSLSYHREEFQGEMVWMIDDLPQGDIAEIFLLNDQGEQDQITDSLVLGSDSIQSAEIYTEWENYTVSNSALMKDTVYEVFCDSRGVNWIGTFGGGLFRDDTWEQFSENEGVPGSVILALEEDQHGAVWCGTSRGIALIEGSTVTPVADAGAPRGSVYDIFRDDQNRLWCGTDQGVYRYDGTWSQFTPDNSGLPDTTIYSITSHSGTLYMGTFGGGIAVFDGTLWETITRENSGLASNHIYALDFDDKGDLWCGTANGISRRSGSFWKTIDEGNSDLPHNTIWSLAVDSEGVVWAGTMKGTVRYENENMRILREDNSRFNSPHSFSIYADKKNKTVLFGTGSGVTLKRSWMR